MHCFYSFLVSSSLVALANCHGVLLGAQGLEGSPSSVGFLVNPEIARNCTDINPCQQDSTIIRDAEIAQNIVNLCGRTQLSGNIDIGEVTENALAAGQVTQVQAGTELTVTIHQVNADGAGPYVCDMDPTSNAGFGLVNLQVTNNVPGTNGLSQAKAQDFDINVTLPDDLNCTGGSTGNICTVRCRNNAQAGPFGGCFAVQQVDVEPNVNTPANIPVFKTGEAVSAEIQTNKENFEAAVAANIEAGSDEAIQNQQEVEELLDLTVTSAVFTAETPSVVLGPVAPPATATAGSGADDDASGGNDGGNGGNDGTNGGNDGIDTGDDAGNGGGGNGRGRGGRFRGGSGRFPQFDGQSVGNGRSRMMRWAKRS